MRVISGREVRTLLSAADLVPAMRGALADFSSGRIPGHPRVTVEADGGVGRVLIMPAAAPGVGVGLKVLSMFDASVAHGLPSVQGLVILLDPVTGEPLALVDGVALTELRTAAVTAVATDLLARADAHRLAVVGAGVQGRAHLDGLAEIRPWSQVKVYSRTAERAAETVAWARERGLPAELAATAEDAAKDADVLCTTTSSLTPVVEDVAVAAEGVHINGVGAFGPRCRELPTALVRRAMLVVDSREAALREAGDLLIPIAEGALDTGHVRAELGEVVAGTRPGRVDDRQTTLFKSLGLPVEDLVAGWLAYERAVQRGVGSPVDIR